MKYCDIELMTKTQKVYKLQELKKMLTSFNIADFGNSSQEFTPNSSKLVRRDIARLNTSLNSK